MAGLLDGMRVLDFSAWRPLPHGTQILADLGAEVLKVEPPGGDPMRAYPEIFASVARGKRSVVLDLRTEGGRARALDLAGAADVVSESWRPGVAERLGVGYPAIASVNPAVIYCSLTGYGQAGAMRDVPGHDVNYQALGGALAPRALDGRDPEVPRLPVADLEGGTVCAVLICAAWARRLQTGEGERIDVALADVVAWWVGPHRGVSQPDASEPTAGSPGYGVFRTSDDRWIAIGVLSEARLWSAICEALRLDDLAELSFADRLARTREINTRVAGAVALLDEHTALAHFTTAGAPASPVLDPEELATHPQFTERDLFVDTSAGLAAALPAVLTHGGRVPASEIPAPDAHTDGFSQRRDRSP